MSFNSFHAVCEALRGKRRKTFDICATGAAARRLEDGNAIVRLGPPPVRFAAVAALAVQRRQ
ncbi:MAG: hypothetical protein ACREC0_07210 [Methylocella sp.]